MAGNGQKQTTVFGLNRSDTDGIHVLIFVSAIRLELTNRVVVLDSAILPLTQVIMTSPTTQQVITALHQSGKLCAINVTADELRLWKKVLPTFIERCRTWKHKTSCEYIKANQIPLISGLEEGKMPLCSCGLGYVPGTFMPELKVPQLDPVLQRFATRAAISPVYAVPYIEDCFMKDGQADVKQRLAEMKVGAENVQPFEPSSDSNTCGVCGKTEATDSAGNPKALLKCGRCLAVKYCSQNCQRARWKTGHKENCRKA